jgi:hypothetical protein
MLGQQKRILNLVLKEVRDLRALNCNEYSYLLLGKTISRDWQVQSRGTDYQGGTIHSSINLPAQSLYHTIPSLYGIFKAAGVGTVIWYCGRSSSI